jgi:hypothetical protein
MAADSDSPIKFPCYVLFGDEGGLITNTVDGHRCLCSFSSTGKVQRFDSASRDQKSGRKGLYRQAKVDEVDNCAGLIGRLTAGVDRLEEDGIWFISLGPFPGQPTARISIRDFIAELQKP